MTIYTISHDMFLVSCLLNVFFCFEIVGSKMRIKNLEAQLALKTTQKQLAKLKAELGDLGSDPV